MPREVVRAECCVNEFIHGAVIPFPLYAFLFGVIGAFRKERVARLHGHHFYRVMQSQGDVRGRLMICTAFERGMNPCETVSCVEEVSGVFLLNPVQMEHISCRLSRQGIPQLLKSRIIPTFPLPLKCAQVTRPPGALPGW